ncbi:hypothetical protein [Bisbaumannia pacifica]|uniref:hypothetical protein n=1 Tax=Bisbaumannia pacifica TaxID=77098 RepID=UPI001E5DA2D0|nr:hypothetical protein [Halomonas pacifica]
MLTADTGSPWNSAATAAYQGHVFGAFLWARCVSNADLVSNADPVHAWVERMLDLHDGLGRRALRISDLDDAYR